MTLTAATSTAEPITPFQAFEAYLRSLILDPQEMLDLFTTLPVDRRWAGFSAVAKKYDVFREPGRYKLRWDCALRGLGLIREFIQADRSPENAGTRGRVIAWEIHARYGAEFSEEYLTRNLLEGVHEFPDHSMPVHFDGSPDFDRFVEGYQLRDFLDHAGDGSGVTLSQMRRIFKGMRPRAREAAQLEWTTFIAWRLQDAAQVNRHDAMWQDIYYHYPAITGSGRPASQEAREEREAFWGIVVDPQLDWTPPPQAAKFDRPVKKVNIRKVRRSTAAAAAA